jgi:putative ABC transport system permease protein
VGRRLPDVWTAVAAGDAAVVSVNFAHNLHVAVGDAVQLDTPNGPLSLRVGGMMDDFLSPRGSITFSRDLYQRWWRDNHIIQALVMTEPGADRKTVRGAILARLGTARSLRVLNAGELVETFAAVVRRAFSAVYALAAMVLVVVALGVADTVAAGVLERRRELATMSALGVRRRALARMALLEAAFLGVVGLVLGLTLGLALGTNWVQTTLPALLGWIIELHLPALDLLATAVLAVFTCLLAGLVPAYRSMQVDLAQAVRDE